MDLLSHAKFPPGILLLQQLFPNVCFRTVPKPQTPPNKLNAKKQRRQNPRLPKNPNPPPNLPALHLRRCRRHLHGLELRTPPRAHLAYYCGSWRCHGRLHNRLVHAKHCWSLYRLLHIPCRRLLGQLRHYRLGVIDAVADAGEAGRRASYA